MLSLTKFLQLMTVLSKIMCNSGRSALGQAGRKHLRSRQSLVTLIGGSSSPPPPRSLGLTHVPSPHPASVFSLGLGPDSSGPGKQTTPTGSPELLGGDEVRTMAGMPT